MDDRSPDPAHADQAQGHAADGRHERAVPAALVDQPVVGGNPSRQCQQERQRLLGDALLVGARGDGDRDPVLGGGGQVDEVVTDAGAGDRAQARGHREELGRHALAAGDHGVDPRQVGEQLLAGECRPSGRIDRLEAGLREDVAESPGGVAEQIRTDQDAWHGQLNPLEGIIVEWDRRDRARMAFPGAAHAFGLRRSIAQLILVWPIRQPRLVGHRSLGPSSLARLLPSRTDDRGPRRGVERAGPAADR